MATGYTHQLKEMKYNVDRWLKERLIRAMRVCVMLRDDGDMSEQDILKGLERSVEKDHRIDGLALAEKELAEFQKNSDAALLKSYEKTRKDAEKEFTQNEIRYNEDKRMHEEALARIEYLDAKASEQGLPADSVVRGTLKFARSQVADTIDYDYKNGPYRPSILDDTFSQWKTGRLESLLHSVTYYRDTIEKQKAFSKMDNAEEYRNFIAFINQAETPNA